MPARILVLNAGSSSLKFGVFETAEEPALLLRGQIAGIGRRAAFRAETRDGETLDTPPIGTLRTHADALPLLLDWLVGQAGPLAAAGHRVVHGGTGFAEPVLVTPAILERLAALGPLAPHHQPHNVAAIRALADAAPDLAQVACFDTAFHSTQPPEARRFPLPREFAERGLVRYGFHGLSYESVVHRLASRGGLPKRLIVAHLGNGASLCAIRDGRSVATTMGFSTLDGLVMATRSGSIDPGLILHLMREGMDLGTIEGLLYDRSGLLGLSGISADMKTLLASPEPGAAQAVSHYCYQARRHIGSLAAALEGVDALVFTGGIGENAAPVRAMICDGLGWLGVRLDAEANAAHAPAISRPGSAVVRIVPTEEERTIARHTQRLLTRAALR